MSESIKAVTALMERKRYNKYERKVKVSKDGMAVLYIFDYPIVAYTKDGRFFCKKPTIIDNNIVISQLNEALARIADVRYWFWRSEINGYVWNGEWIEIINAGSVRIYNQQNPFKLYEH